METIGILTGVIIVLNVLFSYMGLRDHRFLDDYSFEVDKILVAKQYKRLLSSGFLHVSWPHLLFNMYSLYVFSESLETYLGPLNFLLIYFGALLGGNLFALFIHRNHGDYSAVGASGAVCGVIFASIALFPGIEIGFPLVNFFIPGWLYGLLYVLITIYGIKSQSDHIGHEAHLGGGIAGLLIAIAVEPISLSINTLPIAAIVIPTAIFIFLIITRPGILLVRNVFKNTKQGFQTVDDKYYTRKKADEKEIDRILEKIHKKGMNSLTAAEKHRLEEFKKK